ncbi:response regulator [Candidatus Woesearchaeota archaeon]|nr:response regulator [Candidatus Woesearchaeota archaeon]
MSQEAKMLEMMVIDDDEGLRESIVDSLAFYGENLGIAVNVDSASDGREGLAKFNERLQNKRPYDAVLTDLSMPVMDGAQVAAEVKRLRPETLVYIISGWQSDSRYTERSGVASGLADKFISKPFDDDIFKTILQEVATKKYPTNSTIHPPPQS